MCLLESFHDAKQSDEELETKGQSMKNSLSSLGDEFKTSSIRYILQNNYLQTCNENMPILDEKILSRSYCANADDSNFSSLFDDLSCEHKVTTQDFNFSQSDFMVTSTQTSQFEQTNRNTGNRKESDIGDNELETLQQEFEDILEEKSYWFSEFAMSQFPRSYDRVLEVCSDKVACSKKTLHQFVCRVELMFLNVSVKQDIFAPSLKVRLLRQYFDVPLKKQEVDSKTDSSEGEVHNQHVPD